MLEDDIYKTSTQFRFWSFTPEKLLALRTATNKLAIRRVRTALREKFLESSTKYQNPIAEPSKDSGETAKPKIVDPETIDYLTLGEELKLVEFYCLQCIRLGKPFNFPINVVATAIQFIKRFYLTNSPMTYHPKQIMPSALFLASKTENHYLSLRDYSSGLRKANLKKVSPSEILAPEFLISQSLRFTFDIRHPHRALKGVYLEISACMKGEATPLPADTRSSTDLQRQLFTLPKIVNGSPTNYNATTFQGRLNQAYARAKETLQSSAILTDAYFLYTPPQICFSALLLADEPLTLFYLSTKLLPSPSSLPNCPSFNNVLATIRACASLLQAGPVSLFDSRDELIRIDKKLYHCRNPDKIDLIKRPPLNPVHPPSSVSLESPAKKQKLSHHSAALSDPNDLFPHDIVKNASAPTHSIQKT